MENAGRAVADACGAHPRRARVAGRGRPGQQWRRRLRRGTPSGRARRCGAAGPARRCRSPEGRCRGGGRALARATRACRARGPRRAPTPSSTHCSARDSIGRSRATARACRGDERGHRAGLRGRSAERDQRHDRRGDGGGGRRRRDRHVLSPQARPSAAARPAPLRPRHVADIGIPERRAGSDQAARRSPIRRSSGGGFPGAARRTPTSTRAATRWWSPARCRRPARRGWPRAGAAGWRRPRDPRVARATRSRSTRREHRGDGPLGRRCRELAELLADTRRNVVVLGPGGGVGAADARWCWRRLAAERAVVLDADALTSFRRRPATP